MPSRADVRVVVEHVLRGMVIVALAIMLWQSLRPALPDARSVVQAQTLRGALPRWSVLPTAPGRIHVQLDSVPSPLERAWLRALAGAGSGVTWRGDLPPLMIGAQSVASPASGVKARIAAPSGSTIVIADDVGVLDTVRAERAGAVLGLSSAVDRLRAQVNGSAAVTALRDSVILHKVLVIGDAGWESKFVVAALEEEGWKVDAFIRVAPGVDVTQGSIATIDTTRYSAVVALDNSIAPYADRILRFSRSGGGVVMAPGAAALAAMAPLRSGGVGDATAPAQVANISGSISRGTLAMAPIVQPRSDAVPLEGRSGTVALAARRIGAGRVLQSGYEDTWRWRMAGGETSVRDHRGWWTELVSNVAYAPRVALPSWTGDVDDAPVADLVSALGPSSARADIARSGLNPSHWMAWLFALLSLSLIAETASRRLRGAR